MTFYKTETKKTQMLGFQKTSINFLQNLYLLTLMEIKSSKFQNTTRNYYIKQTPNHRESINEKQLSREPNKLKNHVLINSRHRRVVSFGCTSFKQDNSFGMKRFKGNQQNRLNTSYRYRDSKITLGQSDVKKIPGRSSMMTQRETQRDRFIRELKSRVLETQNDSYIQTFQLQEDSHHSSKQFQDYQTLKHNRERAVSSNSIIDIQTDQNQSKERNAFSLIKIKTTQNQSEDKKDSNRSRAKTFAKDFSKLVEDNLAFQLQADNQYSKTLQFNLNEVKNQDSRSLEQLQYIKNMRPSPQGVPTQNKKEDKQSRDQIHKQDQEKLNHSSSNSSLKRYDTKIYEEEVQQLTSDFFSEWDKMNSNKSQLYQKLRNKLVAAYPKMRKKYSKYELPQEQQSHQFNHSDMMSPAVRSSLRISFQNLKSESSEPIYLTVTQLHDKSIEEETFKDKKILKDIFKQAYFWSKAKKKCFKTTYDKNSPEFQAQKQINNIQKNITFMSYMTKRNWKKGMNKNAVRGQNILKHKQSILQLQRPGSPQHHRLQKCLDDAIQTCIRQNM